MSEQMHAQNEVSMFFRLSQEAMGLMRCDPASASVEAEELRDEVDLLAEMTERQTVRAQALRLLDRLDAWSGAIR